MRNSSGHGSGTSWLSSATAAILVRSRQQGPFEAWIASNSPSSISGISPRRTSMTRSRAVINAYVQLPLQRLWGKGKSASADGMKWDLYPQNLMSEYHIRYGGYGGIGYYMVSDSYIALMSRFTTCGSWEGHYILDFLKEKGFIYMTTCSL